jgi:hypothetical protein
MQRKKEIRLNEIESRIKREKEKKGSRRLERMKEAHQ